MKPFMAEKPISSLPQSKALINISHKMTPLARDNAGVTPTIRGKLPTKNGRLYIGLGD